MGGEEHQHGNLVCLGGRYKVHLRQKFQVNVDALDLQSDVPVNGTYTVVVDMRAPGTAGRYSATWAFVSGSKTLCILPITIDVKN